ncbi:hypothetical protein Lser_V15G05528 [Lactuca serriola]
MQQQQQQQQHLQQIPPQGQQQQQAAPPQQQQMVGTRMNKGYVQGPGGRTQMVVSQGQVSSQGPQSI